MDAQIHDAIHGIRHALQQVIVGQEKTIDAVLTGLFAGGHVLLEGTPGLGKTLLAKTLSQLLALRYARIQCTPDLAPTDILGTREAPGPIFANLLLVDQINRARPGTQAGLLEAMEEHQVTLGGVSIPLAQPFMMLATQNPFAQEGVYPLLDAQLDRFLLKVDVPYPTEAELYEIARRTTQGHVPVLTPLLDAAAVCATQAAVRAIPVPEMVLRSVARLVLATRPAWESRDAATDLVRRYVLEGASPRGAQAVILAAKVSALMNGRPAITAHDIEAVAMPALQHRLMINFEGDASAISPDRIVQDVLDHGNWR